VLRASATQAAMQEQQQLWDEQRTALQDSLDVMRNSADANAAAVAAASQAPHFGSSTRQQADLVLFLEGKVGIGKAALS